MTMTENNNGSPSTRFARSGNIIQRSAGQVTLPFILLVGGIIIEIALAGVFASYFLSTGNLGEKLAARASAAAHSGMEDAIGKITQNKELGNASYTLDIGNEKAELEISKVEDAATGSYTYTIESRGIAGNRRKKLRGKIVVEKVTGKVALQSLEEVPGL
ncbi:MAG: hypothetical protein Q8P01_06055 [bacterium]|nr:hypothetical protein [bacterium]